MKRIEVNLIPETCDDLAHAERVLTRLRVVIDQLYDRIQGVDTPGDWIRVPAIGDPKDCDAFHRVISRSRWASVARGENYLRQYHDRPDPAQVYMSGRFVVLTLGTWSGWVDEYGFLRDDALPEDSPLCPF